MGYFTQTDLENALSIPVVRNAYDDDRDGTADTAPIAACIEYATAQCDSFLRKVAATVGSSSGSWTAADLPMASPPPEVKYAALDFGIAYSIRRRPDISKAMGEQPWTVFYDQAVEQMKRYIASVQMVAPTAMSHATVGGSIFGGVTGTCLPEPRWGDMGDFG